MKELLEKIKEGLFNLDANLEPTSAIRLIKARKIILKALQNALITQKVIGIYSPPLGEGMFLTGVESITTLGKEEIITLKPYDMNGIQLVRTDIAISEIRSACPFDSFYLNPFLFKEKEATA
jgi:hypothetical protein